MDWRLASYVAIGGACGSVARWALVAWVIGRLGPAFPWGTLAVNVAGSLAIGAVGAFARTGAFGVSPEVRTFVVIGILGGFTTFSSFSFEALGLLERGAVLQAAGYVLGSVVLGLAAAAAGFSAARLLVAGVA